MNGRAVATTLAAAAVQGAVCALVTRLLSRPQTAPLPGATAPPVVATEPPLALSLPAASAPTAAAVAEALSAIERRLTGVERDLAAAAQRSAAAPLSSSAPFAAGRSLAELLDAADTPAAGPPPNGLPAEFPRERPAESYLDEGNVYFTVGQYDRAVERFSRALQLDPGLGRAYYNRAAALLRLEREADALADYDRAAALLSGDADVLHNRGLLHFARGDFAAAARDFAQALALAPGDADAHVNLGLVRLETGDAEEALQQFTQALAGGGASVAEYGAALALAALGRSAEAVDRLLRALATDPALADSARREPRLAHLIADRRLQSHLSERA